MNIWHFSPIDLSSSRVKVVILNYKLFIQVRMYLVVLIYARFFRFLLCFHLLQNNPLMLLERKWHSSTLITKRVWFAHTTLRSALSTFYCHFYTMISPAHDRNRKSAFQLKIFFFVIEWKVSSVIMVVF